MTAIGQAFVTHQTAISVATAANRCAAAGNPSGIGQIQTTPNNTNPPSVPSGGCRSRRSSDRLIDGSSQVNAKRDTITRKRWKCEDHAPLLLSTFRPSLLLCEFATCLRELFRLRPCELQAVPYHITNFNQYPPLWNAPMTTPWQIGVFTSIDAGLGVHLDVAQELGIPTVQVHSPHGESRNQKTADDFLAQLKAAGITLTCVFTGFEGESYADIATTARTVGLVPGSDAGRAGQGDEGGLRLRQAAEVQHGRPAHRLRAGAEQRRATRDLLAVTQDVLDHVAKNGQNLHLETGQESAEHLLEFLHDVNRPNLFINFDPANMILYGTGNPIEALKKVGKYVRSVHCKDAKWAAGRPARQSLGPGSPARGRGRRHGELSADAQGNRLSSAR